MSGVQWTATEFNSPAKTVAKLIVLAFKRSFDTSPRYTKARGPTEAP